MKVWAIVEAGKVRSTSVEEPVVSTAQTKYEVPVEYIEFVNEDYVSTIDSIAPPSLEYFQGQLLAAIAAKRWEVQSSGVRVNGVVYPSDPDSVKVITEAATVVRLQEMQAATNALQSVVAVIDPEETAPVVEEEVITGSMSLKVNGVFMNVPLLHITTIAKLLNTHVQSTFAVEAWAANKITTAGTFSAKFLAFRSAVTRQWSTLAGIDNVSNAGKQL